ncbi:hypothetical protein PSCLAVI8L_320043 [Pseudoclavibacter sp. 8L]|nr:hypothetical protein PSCLAVI8L_320043 [Pseudoclavibacter sp. 8L]
MRLVLDTVSLIPSAPHLVPRMSTLDDNHPIMRRIRFITRVVIPRGRSSRAPEGPGERSSQWLHADPQPRGRQRRIHHQCTRQPSTARDSSSSTARWC